MLWAPDAQYGRYIGSILPDVLLGNAHFEKLFTFSSTQASKTFSTQEFFQEFHYNRLDSGQSEFVVAVDSCCVDYSFAELKRLVAQTKELARRFQLPEIHPAVVEQIYSMGRQLMGRAYIKCTKVYLNARSRSVADTHRDGFKLPNVLPPKVDTRPRTLPITPESAQELERREAARANAALERQRQAEYEAKQELAKRRRRLEEEQRQASLAAQQARVEAERVRLRDLQYARTEEHERKLAELAAKVEAFELAKKAFEAGKPRVTCVIVSSHGLDTFEDSPAPVKRIIIEYPVAPKPVVVVEATEPVEKPKQVKVPTYVPVDMPNTNKPGEGYGSTGCLDLHCTCGIPSLNDLDVFDGLDDFVEFNEEHVELGLQALPRIGLSVRYFLRSEDKVSTIDGFIKPF